MRLFKRGPEWEILKVSRTPTGTWVEAKHLKTGLIVRLLRNPGYGPHVDELKSCLRLELENQLNPEFAEHRRTRLDTLPGRRL